MLQSLKQQLLSKFKDDYRTAYCVLFCTPHEIRFFGDIYIGVSNLMSAFRCSNVNILFQFFSLFHRFSMRLKQEILMHLHMRLNKYFIRVKMELMYQCLQFIKRYVHIYSITFTYIFYKKIEISIKQSFQDLKKDGTKPVLLYGYGGFNVNLTPSFGVSRIVFMNNFDGIFACPNIRGGG